MFSGVMFALLQKSQHLWYSSQMLISLQSTSLTIGNEVTSQLAGIMVFTFASIPLPNRSRLIIYNYIPFNSLLLVKYVFFRCSANNSSMGTIFYCLILDCTGNIFPWTRKAAQTVLALVNVERGCPISSYNGCDCLKRNLLALNETTLNPQNLRTGQQKPFAWKKLGCSLQL